MGLAKGIFTVDTHTHGQRHAVRFQKRGVTPDYATLSNEMTAGATIFSNAPRMLYHMDRYSIDVCVLLPAFSFTNELNAQIVKEHPDRFVAFCSEQETRKSGKPWNLKDSVENLDRLLSSGLYKGVGEGLPGGTRVGKDGKPITWPERFEHLCAYFEVIKKNKVVAEYHTGFPSGYAAGGWQSRIQGHYEDPFANPLLCHEIASEFPDVPIIMCHGGIEGSGYYTEYYEKCLNVAASHHNVYLECGQWWAELYEKPLKDPNIGAGKLLFGTDWGASCTPQSWMPGCVPETYVNQDISLGPPSHQCDVWGWALRELGRLNIPQDDLNLILGGNAVRLLGIKTPHTRLFKEYLNKKPMLWYQDPPAAK